METPKVSVIIPVYNTGKYLTPCIESVLAQDYPNLEILIVNDGSTDGSDAVIDRFAGQDSRIVPIHQKNAGVSSARNAGLDRATGDWIAFVDSDDILEPGAYSALMAMAMEQNVDAVMFEYQSDFPTGETRPHHFEEESHYGLLDNRKAMYCVYNGACFSVTKIYHRKLLSDVRYKMDIYRGEDTIFLVEALAKANRVYSTPQIFYHYIQSEGSAARGGITARQLTGIDALKWMLDYADRNYPELRYAGVRGYVNIMVEFYYEMRLFDYRDNGRMEQIMRETKKYRKEVLSSPNISKHQKRKFKLFFLSPNLFYQILRRTRKGAV